MTTKIVNNLIELSFPPEARRPVLAAKDKAVTAPVCAARSRTQLRPEGKRDRQIEVMRESDRKCGRWGEKKRTEKEGKVEVTVQEK